MSAMEAIKGGFITANKNLGLVLFLFICSLIGNLAKYRLEKLTTAVPKTRVIWLILAVILLSIWVFMKGGILGIIRDDIQAGKARLVNFVRYGLKYYLRLLGCDLLVVGTAIVVFAIVLLVSMSLAIANVGFLSMIVAFVLMGIGLYWWLLLATFSSYEIVCTEVSVMQALAGSVDITRRAITKVTFLIVITILISLAWEAALKFIPGNNRLLVAILESVFNGYFGIIISASFMVLYGSLTAE